MDKRVEIPPEHRPQKSCEGCPFGGPKVGSRGQIDANFVLVGESPGREEVRTGIPFSGPSGDVLHTFIPRDRPIYVLNAMECHPRKGLKDEKRLNYAAKCCNKRLIDKLTAYPRRIIVAMGNPAVRSLTGDYSLKITQIRGRLIKSPYAEIGILPVIHPAALMRGTGSYRQFRQDLEYALEIADGGDVRVYEKPKWITVTDPKLAIRHLLRQELKHNDGQILLTCDIETAGFDFRTDDILDIGITGRDKSPVYCFGTEHLPWLKPLFESKSIQWCWHNGKFDIKFLRSQWGIKARVDDDTMLMSYTLDETGGVHDLETVASDVLNAPDYKDMLKPYLPTKGTSYAAIPKPVLHEYMSIDVANTAAIRNIYRARIKKDPALEKLYTKTLIPASELLAQVETNGFHVDVEWLNDAEEYLDEEIDKSRKKVIELAGVDFNPNSPQQLKDILFKHLKLPNIGKGSTDKHVLEKLRDNPRTDHPILTALLEYRKVAKAQSTYVRGMRKHIQPDGRIHATYLLHGTVTGRLASRKPNLQNIPRDWIIRGIFDAAPGYVILEVDLSQAELRSLAALSGDPNLVQVYLSGGSIHKELALFLFGEEWERKYNMPKGTPEYAEAYEQYTRCKNVNFGIVYGITARGLSDQINDTVAVAQRYIDGWANRFPVAWDFIARCRRAPRYNQVITTTFGRKKRVGIVTQANIKNLMNEAANFPHQSIASDITLHSAIRIAPWLTQFDARIVNLVHDAILMEVPNDYTTVVTIANHVKSVMSQVPRDWGITRVPFTADAEVGDRWGSCVDIEEYYHGAYKEDA